MTIEKNIENTKKPYAEWKKGKDMSVKIDMFAAYVNEITGIIQRERINDAHQKKREFLYEYILVQADKKIENELIDVFTKGHISLEECAELFLILDNSVKQESLQYKRS